MRRLVLVSLPPLLLLLAAGGIAAQTSVEFNRDVRPILADHCFQCHGPDAKQRQADLRLDTSDATAANRDGGPVVVPGKPEKSELWRRITSTDADQRMPPPDKGRKLTDSEIAILRQWIADGAKFERHWSLLPVHRPPLPKVDSPRSPLDAFVLARLEKERLAPSPEADRTTLLRRVTLALTGLPPTLDEIQTFLHDDSPDAYEQTVDRLLASPRYGERMAVPWLDAARYADTSGYQSDGERFMWRWRDWVIEALNANMPFDQFTIEQLAGDLLPESTLDQRIATGFHRNHRGNAEGGIIPEEYAVEYVADRVETTSTVWLGLTLGCSRCHDHKYDPFSQRDFYNLFAFFNNVPEQGRAIKLGNSPPYIAAPTRQQQKELERRTERFSLALRAFADDSNASAAQLAWEQAIGSADLGDWYPAEKLVVYLPLNDELKDGVNEQHVELSVSECRYVAGAIGRAMEFDGQASLVLPKAGDFGFLSKFTLAAWVRVGERGGTIISRMTDEPQGDGYQLAVVDGKLQLNLVKRWLDDALRVETADELPRSGWHHVAATYDGSRVAEGVKLYVNGQPQKQTVLLDELNQSFSTKEPLRVGAGGGPESRFRGAIDEVRVYASSLSTEDVQVLATAQSLTEIVAIDPRKRTDGQELKLSGFYLEHHAPSELQRANQEKKDAERALAEFREKLPTVMVMEEMPMPRQAHVLIRGQYDKPGEPANPSVPAELSRMSESSPRNRLGLAQWIVASDNPLTSRVAVNRAWQLHFGAGLVKTAEDFGRQGEWPSHPDLLDWLAAEFQSDWDVKRLHRMIVTSATYRQSSENPKSQIPNPKLIDPDNRLLSRGPRLRLSAEMVRDQALFASGLLAEQLGGPSVRPLQPAGLWSELTGGDDYKAGSGSELVRRSLYTFWKRTIPPPTLTTFDSSSREACVVRESRTNTPLQALVLLNEPTFVMAARSLAERVMREAATPDLRIERAMLLVLGRRPTDNELAIFRAALERYKGRGNEYELLCSTILNLDEAVTMQ